MFSNQPCRSSLLVHRCSKVEIFIKWAENIWSIAKERFSGHIKWTTRVITRKSMNFAVFCLLSLSPEQRPLCWEIGDLCLWLKSFHVRQWPWINEFTRGDIFVFGRWQVNQHRCRRLSSPIRCPCQIGQRWPKKRSSSKTTNWHAMNNVTIVVLDATIRSTAKCAAETVSPGRRSVCSTSLLCSWGLTPRSPVFFSLISEPSVVF